MSERYSHRKTSYRVDANEKVTGQIVYGYDPRYPICSMARRCLAPKRTPKIKKINTEKG